MVTHADCGIVHHCPRALCWCACKLPCCATVLLVSLFDLFVPACSTSVHGGSPPGGGAEVAAWGHMIAEQRQCTPHLTGCHMSWMCISSRWPAHHVGARAARQPATLCIVSYACRAGPEVGADASKPAEPILFLLRAFAFLRKRKRVQTKPAFC